ncbi:MAG: GAF domain-containing protein, partial [Proteobacteria bacterium]|nr:GAF domain-containing protein [Pseudomonadota bacterium]
MTEFRSHRSPVRTPRRADARARDVPDHRLLESGLRLLEARSEDELCQLLLDEAAQLTGAQRVLLVLESAQALRCAASTVLPRGETPEQLLQAIRPWLDQAGGSRTPSLRHGPEGAAASAQRSCMVAPLVAHDELLGYLYADVEGHLGRFDACHRDALAVLARHGAAGLTTTRIAAQNAQLAGEAQAAMKQLEERGIELTESLEYQTAVSDVLRAISESQTSVTPVFEAILDCTMWLFEGPASAIFLYDGTQVQLAATRNWSPEALEAARTVWPAPPDARQINGRAILTRQTQSSDDAWADANYDRRLANSGDRRRVIGAPMLKDGEPIGAITTAWPHPGKTPQRQIDLLKVFADQAVMAIENVRLVNENKAARAAAEATNEAKSAFLATMSHEIRTP